MSGEAKRVDSKNSYLAEDGSLVRDAKESYNAARSSCPHSRTNKFGMSVCGLVLSNSPSNKTKRTGTISVAECGVNGDDIDNLNCSLLCQKAVDFQG